MAEDIKKPRCIALVKHRHGNQCSREGVLEGFCVTHFRMNNKKWVWTINHIE